MKKIKNLQYIQYVNNFNIISSTLQKWYKKKPIEEVQDMLESMGEIAGYVNTLESNETIKDQIVVEYRSDKIRAVERAERAEDKCDKLESKVQKLQTQKELGL
tara:strand:- start:385 stop:693 length:309 start_codon:yes stop_codon:yes gene_type:complete